MKKTILIADDSPSIRQVVKMALTEAGYNVVEAADGVEALSRIDETTVHMVLVDLNMPKIDGLDVIRGIRANPAHKFVPIVMITTESSVSKRQEGRACGATGWIIKPFKQEQLLSVIKKLISG
ncbi:chemotaxis protein CheY [Candidatus Magnetobacterium bavaricum]|uniref:Chemotaxis protein CheY n=1 Tax=Candidatus Magnetobacterium bavaricum TaxID=29290 RepID=A0A0F3GKG0_9BACT|nr:chemotaxis protein CheY [Candidatus Magnetobacterium bavaricum]